jgi:hypothetical protein
MSIRDELFQEINDTRTQFQKLLDSIPETAYDLPSDNPAWTIGEVLYHMSIAPRLLIRDVRMIVGQNWLYRLVPLVFPKRLFNWLNETLTRYKARNPSREFLTAEYEKAHRITLKALSEVSDKEFEKSVFYPDWDPLLAGEVTLEKLFHYVKAHFESHAKQILLISDNLDD